MFRTKLTIRSFGCVAVLTHFGVSALTALQKTARFDVDYPGITPFDIGDWKTATLAAEPARIDAIADPGPPRMLASLGCDGSTAILNHAYAILPLHGVNPGPADVQKELLDPYRNEFITTDNQDIIVAMERLWDSHKKAGETLVFKSIFKRDRDATLDRRLVDMGTLVVLSTRRNVLDKLVCMVRDCFLDEWARDDVKIEDTAYGYPVDQEGNINRMCFNRRAANASTKAMLVASELAENLNMLAESQDDAVKELLEAGYEAPRVDYDDMLSFEEEAKFIPDAVEAWSATLKAWGVQPSRDKLVEYFREHVGTRSRAEPHHELIYNIDDIKAELVKANKLYLYRA